MEISSGINNPVNLYTTSTGNNLNLAVESENKIYGANIFSSEFAIKEAEKTTTHPNKKKKRNRRLNTIDSDYLPDEEIENQIIENGSNFFVKKKENKYKEKLKSAIEYIFTSIPLINYFYLRNKEHKIQKTVESLSNIVQNADDYINTTVPFGENSSFYNNLAKNLTDGAIIVGKANKEI